MSQKSKIKNVYSDLFGVSSDLFKEYAKNHNILMNFITENVKTINSIKRRIEKKEDAPE